MEQNLADRGDGEELIETKVWGCAFDGQLTTALSSVPLLCDMELSLLIMQ